MKPDYVKCENCVYWKNNDDDKWDDYCYFNPEITERGANEFCSHFTQEWPCDLCGSGLNRAGDCPLCDEAEKTARLKKDKERE